jgi:hypothetical protein
VQRRTSLALIAASLASAAAAAEPQLIDAKVWGSGASLLAPTWLDARRVLFLSGPAFKPNEQRRTLATWELDGKASSYRENINHYCYRDGVIVYKALDAADPNMVRGTWYSGTLGSERPVRKDAGGDIARLYDPLNCKIATNEELQKRPGRGQIPLLEKHGYLDLRAGQVPGLVQNLPVQYVRAADKAAIKLPFGTQEFNAAATYFDFADSYLIRSIYFDPAKRTTVVPWPAQLERPLWLLKPDGTVAKQVIPKGPWTGKDDPLLYLTGAGLVLVRYGGNVDHADGVYLAEGESVRHLLPGRAGPVGVSPDGCSIAFTHAPSAEADVEDVKENRRTLKVMRLCASKS